MPRAGVDMDFVFAHGFDLTPHAKYLESCAIIRTDQVTATALRGDCQYFLSGRTGSILTTEADIRFFDGQCSFAGQFYHPGLRNCDIRPAVEAALRHDGTISNGVFCAGEIGREGGSTRFMLTTDWLGQYPIYCFTDRRRLAVSNNLLMMEAVCGASRSILAAVENLVTGGAYRCTGLEGVRRLDVGTYLKFSETDTLRTLKRGDHHSDTVPYPDALAMARTEISRHVSCVISDVSDSYIVTDLTGGSDSRAVLSFLLESVNREHLYIFCAGRYPNPDANVAAFLTDTLGLQACHFPTSDLPPDFAPRTNAALSAGARDSGPTLSPVGFTNFVHFKGSFGELGGATPGSDYVREAFGQGLTLGDGVEQFIRRRRRAKALELLTDEGIAFAKAALVNHYEHLLEAGIDEAQLLAERYLQARCRTHFGLSSYLENKSRILPAPLANRWIVEARRSVDPELASKNKVIYDLVLSSQHRELAFYPMANKKWSERIVQAGDRNAYDAMAVIDFDSVELCSRRPLWTPVAVEGAPLTEYAPLPLQLSPEESAVTPQFGHLSLNKAMLRLFLNSLDQNDDCWRLISRQKVLESVDKRASEFRADGIDINAMGTVASAFVWRAGLEVKPALLAIRSFVPTAVQ